MSDSKPFFKKKLIQFYEIYRTKFNSINEFTNFSMIFQSNSTFS